MQNNYPLLTDNQTAAIIQQYPLEAPLPDHAAWFPSLSSAYGDATFTCPGISVLDAFRQYSQETPAWSYRTDIYDATDAAMGLGVFHGFESWAIFGVDSIGGAPAGYYTYNAPIVPVIMDYWISFVRDLSPNTYKNAAAPEWRPWGSSGPGNESRIVYVTNNTHMETLPTTQKQKCEFWKGLSTTMQQKRGLGS